MPDSLSRRLKEPIYMARFLITFVDDFSLYFPEIFERQEGRKKQSRSAYL